jgi:hypothetical protein
LGLRNIVNFAYRPALLRCCSFVNVLCASHNVSFWIFPESHTEDLHSKRMVSGNSPASHCEVRSSGSTARGFVQVNYSVEWVGEA